MHSFLNGNTSAGMLGISRMNEEVLYIPCKYLSSTVTPSEIAPCLPDVIVYQFFSDELFEEVLVGN